MNPDCVQRVNEYEWCMPTASGTPARANVKQRNRAHSPVSYFQRDQTFVDRGAGERGKENIIRRTMYTKRTRLPVLWGIVAPRRSKKRNVATMDLFHPAGTIKTESSFLSPRFRNGTHCRALEGARLVLYAIVKSGAPNIRQFFFRKYTRGENTSQLRAWSNSRRRSPRVLYG